MLKGVYKANMTAHPELKHLRFNLTNMRTSFDEFRYRISPIEDLQQGDKLSMTIHIIENKEYHRFSLCKAGNLQSFQRWWYAESRVHTLNHLKKNFLEYIQFVDMCVDATRVHVYDNSYLQLCYENIEFQDKIRDGLTNLKKTYAADAEQEEEYAVKLSKYINVILDTFNDFKTHIIRRAYRRLYRKKFIERLDEVNLENTTTNGVDLVMKLDNALENEVPEVQTPVPESQEETKLTQKETVLTKSGNMIPITRVLPNTLEELENEYPGSKEELKQHVEAIECGEEETSSYYDSEEEGDCYQRTVVEGDDEDTPTERHFFQEMRKQIKTSSAEILHKKQQGKSRNKKRKQLKNQEKIVAMSTMSLDDPDMFKE